MVETYTDKEFFDKFKDSFNLVKNKYKFIWKGYSSKENTVRVWASEWNKGEENLYFQIGLHNHNFKKSLNGCIYKLKKGFKFTNRGEDYVDIIFDNTNFFPIFTDAIPVNVEPKVVSLGSPKLGNIGFENKMPSLEIPSLENSIKPNHCKSKINIDVIDFCEAYSLDFSLGNVIKYVCRAGKKDNNSELQDLLKAKEYLERKIKSLE